MTQSPPVDLLSAAWLGQPTSALGLALVPLFPRHAPPDFLEATGALAQGALDLSEKAEGGPSVPVAHAANTGGLPVLVPDGTLLLGGWQDRVSVAPAWLAPGTTREIPVHCVEQRRWQARGGDHRFRADRAPVDLQRLRRRHGEGQGDTWAATAELRRRRGLSDGSGSAHEGRDLARLDVLAEQLVLPWSASGVVVYWRHPGETSWPLVEWCASPDAFRGAWPALRRGILEAHLARLDARGLRLDRAEAPRIHLSRLVPRLRSLDRARPLRTVEAGPRAEARELHRRGHSTLLHGWETRVEGQLVHLRVDRERLVAA